MQEWFNFASFWVFELSSKTERIGVQTEHPSPLFFTLIHRAADGHSRSFLNISILLAFVVEYLLAIVTRSPSTRLVPRPSPFLLMMSSSKVELVLDGDWFPWLLFFYCSICRTMWWRKRTKSKMNSMDGPLLKMHHRAVTNRTMEVMTGGQLILRMHPPYLHLSSNKRSQALFNSMAMYADFNNFPLSVILFPYLVKRDNTRNDVQLYNCIVIYETCIIKNWLFLCTEICLYFMDFGI